MASGTINAPAILTEAAWTAASSSVAGYQLTAKATLTKGLYIAIIRTPSISSEKWAALCGDNHTEFNSAYFIMQSLNTITMIITIDTASEDVWLKTGSSGSTTYTNTEYAGLQFVRIA